MYTLSNNTMGFFLTFHFSLHRFVHSSDNKRLLSICFQSKLICYISSDAYRYSMVANTKSQSCFFSKYLFRLFFLAVVPLPIGVVQISSCCNKPFNTETHFLECNFLTAFASFNLMYSLDIPNIFPTSSKVLGSPSFNPKRQRITFSS